MSNVFFDIWFMLCRNAQVSAVRTIKAGPDVKFDFMIS